MAAAMDGCKTQAKPVRLNLIVVDEGDPVRLNLIAVCCAGALPAPGLYQGSSNCIPCRVSSSPALALPAIQFPVHPSFASFVVSPTASFCPSLPITSGFHLRFPVAVCSWSPFDTVDGTKSPRLHRCRERFPFRPCPAGGGITGRVELVSAGCAAIPAVPASV